ncbi:MAG TPA: hypothetical protein VM166_15715 [Gemmatimonadaceae bacterium]|nr:hypothetical protein [Gemmatimonadaceae bacterium]
MSEGMICRFAGIAFFSAIGISCAEPSGPAEGSGGPIVLPATVLAALSPTTGTGNVGSIVDDVPTVIAQDTNGNPVPNILVTFTQTKGAGIVTGGVVMTNVAGIARPARWTLSVKAEANVVTASAGSVGPLTFTVTGIAGPPASLVKVAGDNQIAAAGTQPVTDPAILLIDAFGNLLGNVSTTFSVTAGGGSVSTSTALTDSLGRASVRWRLGERGGQGMTVSVPNVAPVTFTAIALDPSSPCGRLTGPSLATTEHSELTGNNCQTSDGRAFETFPVLLTAGTYLFILASKDFDAELEIRDENMNLVASNNDGSLAGTNSSIKIVARKGLYTIVAKSHVANQRGAFDLSYRAAAAVSKCEEAYVTRGIVTNQSVESTDCERGESDREGRYRIFLKAGESVFVGLEDTSYSGPSLEITDSSGKSVSAVRRTAYVSDITFVPAADGLYTVVVWGPSDEFMQFVLTIK